MRKTLLTSAALFGLAFSLPAFAQSADWPWAHQPGTGESGPASSTASNIDSTDARSSIAPHLPEPAQGQNGSPEAYLRDAQSALMRHQSGLAQQSLEMAETRLLDRSTLPSEASTPDQTPEIRNVSAALNAIGHHDWEGARHAIQVALASAPGYGMAGPAAYNAPYGNPGMQPGGMAPPNAYPSPGAYPPPDGTRVGGPVNR
jgi:hypothetical protein